MKLTWDKFMCMAWILLAIMHVIDKSPLSWIPALIMSLALASLHFQVHQLKSEKESEDVK